MGAVLFPLSFAMMVGGVAAVYFGAPIITAERGWAMVLSGSLVGSAGAVLLGLASAGERLKRVERAILSARTTYAGGSASSPAVAASPAPAPSAEPGPGRIDIPAPSAPSAPLVPAASAPTPVVGSYNAGVNSYDMYADGSIRAMMPDGEHRFGSMGEFRAFMTAKGASSPAPKDGATPVAFQQSPPVSALGSEAG